MKKFMTLAVAMVLFLGLGMFNIAAALEMTGTYYIGATGTAPGGTDPNFSTLNAACDSLSKATITGNVTMYITSNLTEPENVDLAVNTAGFTITFKPYTGITPTVTYTQTADNAGTSGAWVIGQKNTSGAALVSTHNIVIDGSNTEAGSTRDLTFVSASGANAYPFRLKGDCDNITIKNCIMTAGLSTIAYGIWINPTLSTTNYIPDNVTIDNCSITSTLNVSATGINVAMTGTTTEQIENLAVRNCDIVARQRGIFLNGKTNVTMIENNTFEINQTTTGYVNAAVMGNNIYSTGTTYILGNDFKVNATANTAAANGNRTIVASGGGKFIIANNFFRGFAAPDAGAIASEIIGIRCGSTVEAYHNTFVMNDIVAAGNSVYRAINVAAGTPIIKNNIFVIEEDNFASYCIGGTPGESDYNDFYLKGTTNAKVSPTGATLADWQTASGKDAHSVSKAVEFASATDLHLAGASIGDNSLYSLPIASVEKDIDGDVRSVYFPYKGADEAATALIGTPPKVFFSEYVEGSSNNKAFEIYNGTNASIDLSKYSVKQANNGSGWGAISTGADTRYVLPLAGTLDAGDVYVVYNGQSVTAISSVGDLSLTYNSTANGGNGDNVAAFNGDDAMGLFYGDLLADVIGVPTVDPGTSWNVAGVTGGTVDHTMIRKPAVTTGNTDWNVVSGTNADDSEWIVKAKDTFGYLGSHNAKPEFTDLKLWSGTDQATWASVTYDVAAGFSMDLNPTIEYYYLTFDTLTATSVPLTPGYYGFTVATHPAGFMDYWAARGVVSGASGWQAIAWEIINGNQPTFYVKVGADGSLRLVDGLQRLAGATDDPYLRINGNYLEGAYTYTGKVTSEFGFESDAITIGITFTSVKPQFTNIVLGSSTDQASWSNVAGDMVNGFSTTIDPAIDWYYLNLLTGTTTNEPLKEGYYGFKVATYPAGFFEYWNGRGVNASDATATGDTAWQKIAWDIINAVEPTFYLKVASDASLKLVDGLQKLAGATDDPYLRIEGNYLPGGYSYTGTVTGSSNVGSDPVSIAITFKEKSDILTVAQLQDTTGAAIAGDSKLKGQWIKTTGIVTAVGSNCLWLQDAPGGWNGIYAYTKTAPAVVVGDSVLVVGKMAEYYFLTEIDSATTTVLASGCVVPAPTVVTAAEFAQEKYEGVLVTVNGVTCTNPSLGSGEWEITDASGKTRVNDKLFVSVGKLNWVYNVTGVGNYDYNNYKIEPRKADDVVVVSSSSSRFVWEKDITSFPFFKNDHLTRGMAYNAATNHLIVASRTGSPMLWILDAATGDTVGRMNMTGVTGGTYALNVPRADKNGVVYACNLSTGSTAPFRIYRWTNETAVPTVAYEVAAPTLRMGDSFAINGADSTTILYVSGSSSTQISVLTTADHGVTYTAGTPITVASGLARGGISPVGDGTLWVNGAGTSTSHISATGTVINAISGGLIDGGWHSVMYVQQPFKKKLVAVVGKNNAYRGNQVQVWNVHESETNPTLVDTVNTTSGYNTNTNACGDLAYKINTDGTATIYELITNNTIAAWTLTLPIDAVTMTVAEAKVDENGDFVPDLAGKTVTLKGLVTTPDYNLTYAKAFSYYFQDATGGINLYAGAYKDTFQIGDEIEVVGLLQQYRGLTEITPSVVTDIKVLSTGNTPIPVKLKISDIGEATEGQYVQLDSVRLVDVTKWPLLGSYATLKLTDGVDTTDFFVDNDTDMDGWANPPKGFFGLRGISSQYTKLTPPNAGYQVIGIDTSHIFYYKEPFKPVALLPFWSKSVNSGNNPAYNTGNYTRGMAVGKMGDKDHAYVVTRNGSHRVVIYNALNGDSLGVIPAPTTAVGTFPINVADVSDDGKLFVCNMTTDASSAPFTVYRWDSETGTPLTVISYNALNKRFGDMMSVAGRADDNTLTIYAAASASTEIVKFTTTDNGQTFTPTVITMPSAMGSVPNVQQADDGTLWIKSAGRQLSHRLADGTIDTVASSVVATGSSKIKYMKWKDSERVLVYYYNPNTAVTAERVDVIDVTGGAAKAEKIAFTLPLGNVGNSNGTGSVDYTVVNDSTFIVYVFGANNGLAAFTNNSEYVPDNIKVAFYGNTATLHLNTSGTGYIAGTNNYGDLGKYQKMQLKLGDALFGFNYFFAAKNIVNLPDTIDLVVRTVGAITGAPDVLLAKIEITTDKLDTVLSHFNAFRLPATITLAGPVFIGVEWKATCDDQFALYADANGEGESAHRAWEKYSDGSFGYFDQPGSSSWALNADLWISALYIEGPDVAVKKEVVIPTEYSLSQNYPNPFNPTTNIELALPKAAKVSLVVFNLIGQEVATVHKGYLPAGHYTFNFNASNLASGVYFYRVEANNYKSLKKMTILK